MSARSVTHVYTNVWAFRTNDVRFVAIGEALNLCFNLTRAMLSERVNRHFVSCIGGGLLPGKVVWFECQGIGAFHTERRFVALDDQARKEPMEAPGRWF